MKKCRDVARGIPTMLKCDIVTVFIQEIVLQDME